MQKIKLVMLDRDGVINHDSENYIKSPEEWRPIPNSLEAIARLNKAGYLVAVATNQSGIGRAFYTLETLKQIHEKMHTLLSAVNAKVHHIQFCPHTSEDQCFCRKPLPGMLHAIAENFDCSLKDVPYIGDKHSDIETALHAGAKPMLVLTGKGKKTQQQLKDTDVDIFNDLSEAVDHILGQE